MTTKNITNSVGHYGIDWHNVDLNNDHFCGFKLTKLINTIMKHFKLGDKVRVSPDNDNENYNSFKDSVLIVTHVAKDRNSHPGYDESVSPDYLYDLETESGEAVNCSLYDYELIKA